MKNKSLVLALGLLTLSTALLTAQKQKPGQATRRRRRARRRRKRSCFRTSADAVNVDVVIRNANGQFLPDLKLNEFVVLEDGVRRRFRLWRCRRAAAS